MRNKGSIWVVCVAAACAWLAPARTIAQTEDQRTYFTFAQPVQLPGGKTLPPGKYIFRLADPTTSRKVVQVLSGDGKMVYGTFLTLPSRRVDAAPDPEVRFMETPAGTPLAVRTWWNGDETLGRELVYPKDQARRLAKGGREPVLTTQAETTTAAQTDTPDLSRINASGGETKVAGGGQPSASAPTGTALKGEAAKSAG